MWGETGGDRAKGHRPSAGRRDSSNKVRIQKHGRYTSKETWRLRK